jgi:hypothetical protein
MKSIIQSMLLVYLMFNLGAVFAGNVPCQPCDNPANPNNPKLKLYYQRAFTACLSGEMSGHTYAQAHEACEYLMSCHGGFTPKVMDAYGGLPAIEIIGSRVTCVTPS